MDIGSNTRYTSGQTTSRDLVLRPAIKGMRIDGGFTPHTQAMRDLITSERLTPFAAHLWQILFDLSNEPRNRDNPRWFPTQRTLCRLTGRSHETVITALIQLESASLLDRGTRSGSSGWVGATLQMPDYQPRRHTHSDGGVRKDVRLDEGNEPFFGTRERSVFPISTDRKNRSESSIAPLYPNEANDRPVKPPDHPTVGVATIGIVVEPKTSHRIGQPDKRRGRLIRSTPISQPNEERLYERLLAFGVSPRGARKALTGLARHNLANLAHVDMLCTHVATAPRIKEPAALLVSLCLDGFQPLTECGRTVDGGINPPPPGDDQRVIQWASVLTLLQADLSSSEFETWLLPTRLLACEELCAVVGASNVFVRDMVRAQYQGQLEAALATVMGRRVQIEVLVDVAIAYRP
ncbi:MAG: hypothetical protein NVS2B7_17470 [Herpetosiphon sp.]